MGVKPIAYSFIIKYLFLSEVTFAAKDFNANSCRVSSASLLLNMNLSLLHFANGSFKRLNNL
jgi:hypothetical protein